LNNEKEDLKNLTESEKAIIELLDLATTQQNIGILNRRPLKHYRKYFDQEKTIERYPSFINCILFRCGEIPKCWDIKKRKWKGSIIGCQLPQKLKKIFLDSRRFKPSKTYLSPTRLTALQIGIITTSLNTFVNNGFWNKAQITEIINILEDSKTIFCMLGER